MSDMRAWRALRSSWFDAPFRDEADRIGASDTIDPIRSFERRGE